MGVPYGVELLRNDRRLMGKSSRGRGERLRRDLAGAKEGWFGLGGREWGAGGGNAEYWRIESSGGMAVGSPSLFFKRLRWFWNQLVML